MLPGFLEDRATSYVCGSMPAAEREVFEALLEYHGELRTLVQTLQSAVGDLAMAHVFTTPPPRRALKDRILSSIAALPASGSPEAVAIGDPAGLIEWVNPAFTELCGYTLQELKGRKAGLVLQGPETDRDTIARIRASLTEQRRCHERLVNYHKDGTLYRVDLRIDPFFDDDHQLL